CLAPVAAVVAALVLVALFAERIHAAAEHARATATTAPSPIWRRKVLAALDHSAAALVTIGRSRRPWHALCHAAALGMIAAYTFVGRQLAAALGFHIGYGKAFAVFDGVLMAAYLAPIPGSYGVGEGA